MTERHYTSRSIEIATKGSRTACSETEVRLIPTVVNGPNGRRSEMLPDDPVATAKILSARNAKRTPAQRAKQRMAAALKKRAR